MNISFVVRQVSAALLTAALLAPAGFADEGCGRLTTPLKLVQDKYNFSLTQQWLDHVRLALGPPQRRRLGVVRQPPRAAAHEPPRRAGAAAEEFDRRARHDATRVSTPRQSDQEMKSPDSEVNVLVSMENVTARVQAAAKDGHGRRAGVREAQGRDRRHRARKPEKTGLRSDVVTLYQGGEYWLYRYKKYTDVRLVFARRAAVAFFGGDPDNFTFPRYDLDFALFRVYENGRPIESQDFLKWNPKGAATASWCSCPAIPDPRNA